MTNYTGIGAIIDAIASTSVLGYTASHEDTLLDGVSTAQLPYRFISHRGAGMVSSQYERTTLSGRAFTASWRIPDIMLLRPVSAGIGVSSIAFDVFNYMGEYAGLIRDVAAQHYVVDDVEQTSGLVEWPEGSEQYYDAVVYMVTVVENN
jgi:hypothetical protein